jgi:hypothetical protein
MSIKMEQQAYHQYEFGQDKTALYQQLFLSIQTAPVKLWMVMLVDGPCPVVLMLVPKQSQPLLIA